MPHSRTPLTLAELVVATFLLLLGTALLAPAVLAEKSAARRTSCSRNLQQIGKGILQYADARQGELPSTGFRDVGWGTRILPQLGHADVYDRYHWDERFNEPENAQAVSTRLQTFVCPAGPHPDRMVVVNEEAGIKAAPSDYIALLITLNPAVQSQFAPGFNPMGVIPIAGTSLFRGSANLSDVTDGRSTTGMIFESADKPNRWQAGEIVTANETGNSGVWAGGALNGYRGYTRDGKEFPGPCGVNCNNQTGIYGFHPGGANIVMADGSAQFISQDIDVYVMYALVSRAGGEVIAREDFAFERPAEKGARVQRH